MALCCGNVDGALVGRSAKYHRTDEGNGALASFKILRKQTGVLETMQSWRGKLFRRITNIIVQDKDKGWSGGKLLHEQTKMSETMQSWHGALFRRIAEVTVKDEE
eukprot:876089-Pelagomonas_calceolata.AAC.1